MSRAVTVILAALLAVTAAAQYRTKLSIPTNRAVREQLARAAEALQHDDAPQALEIYQKLLDGRGDRLVALAAGPERVAAASAEEASGTWIGVRAYVAGLVNENPELLAHYRRHVDARAKKLLEAGLRGDEASLVACARRFALTPHGPAAQLALVDLQLEQGRFHDAALSSRRWRSRRAELADHEPLVVRLLAREAMALKGDRRLDELSALLDTLTERARKAPVRIAGKGVVLGEFIVSLVGKGVPPMPPRRPLASFKPRWEEGIERNRTSSRRRRRYSFDDDEDELGDYFAVVPAVSGDVVYYCDGLKLEARSLATKKELWTVPSPSYDFDGSAHRDLQFEAVVDRDLVIAYLQGDPLVENAWRRSTDVPSFKLVAVDRATGHTRWSHLVVPFGDPAHEFLLGLSVSQPPLVIGDVLYVAGTTFKGSFHHWVCAIDRGTGALRWKAYVGSGQTDMGRGGTPRRSSVPGRVAEADGVLFYGTNMGGLCAVEAATGAILWLTEYQQAADVREFRGRRSRWRSYEPDRNPRFLPTRPLVHGDKVYFGPTDSLFVLAADRATGAIRPFTAASPSTGERGKTLLGIHDGHLILGGRECRAIDLADGRTKWRLPRDTATAVGRPVLHEGRIWYCTFDQLRCADLADGKDLDHLDLMDPEQSGSVAIDRTGIALGGLQAVTGLR